MFISSRSQFVDALLAEWEQIPTSVTQTLRDVYGRWSNKRKALSKSFIQNVYGCLSSWFEKMLLLNVYI